MWGRWTFTPLDVEARRKDGRPLGHVVENGPTFFEARAIAATVLGCDAQAMTHENTPVNDVSPNKAPDVWRDYPKPVKKAKKRKKKTTK